MDNISTKSTFGRTQSSRRNFLKTTAGSLLAAGVITTVTSCSKHSDNLVTTPKLGQGDTGLLNTAYAIEQLELAFYTKVTSAYYVNATAYEKSLFSDIASHEVAHTDVFHTVLGTNGLPNLTFDFSHVDFTDRTSVLNFARLVENTGVAAYNGAAYLYNGADFMAVTGKIVSVEARHATVINNFISFGSFIDNTYVDLSTGIDRSITPSEALAFVNTYSTKKISA